MSRGNKHENVLFWVVVIAGCALFISILRKLIF